MKNNRLFATAKRVLAVFAVTLIFAGCEGLLPGFGEPENEEITITATTEKTTSRTTLNASDEVVWQAEDWITLYDMATGINTESFSISGGVGTTSATFTGQKPDWTGSTWVYYGDLAYGVYSAKVPATQVYDKNGGFSINVNPMAAVCENLEDGIQFKNLAGIIELQISGTQTLASIEVSAKEHLSGYYDLDQTTLEKSSSQYAVSSGSNVTLTDINVQLDEQNAKSFKIVVMPGTYTEFTVKMTNADGSVVTKSAEEEIIVERSKITPIAGLVDSAEPVEVPKYVTLSLVEAETNWHQAKVVSQIHEGANGVLYMWGDDAYVEEWKTANPDKQFIEMMIENGGMYAENIEFSYTLAPGTNYNFYAVGLLIGEDNNASIVGDIFHLTYKPEIPYDETASLTVEVPQSSLLENSAVVHITPSTTFAKVYVSLYTAAVDANNSEALIFYNVAIKPARIIENVSTAIDVEFEPLTPNTELVAYVIGETAEGKYTHLTKAFFKTPEHVAAAVTATAEAVEVKDWTAKFNITLSEGATGYKYAFFTKATYDNNPTVDWAHEVSTYDTFSTNTELNAKNLTEDTEYVLITIAYDANDTYGAASMLNFTTTALVADYNVVGYDKFLGEWTVSYTGSDGTRFEDNYIATVSQVVRGKLYAIKGLGGTGLGDIDDTVYARFNGDGQPITIPDSEVLYAGQYDANYHILMTMIFGNSLYINGPSIWENADGTYGVGEPSDPVNSGFGISAFYKSNGEYAGSLTLFKNVIMKKRSEYGASTEKFNRQETVFPNWKSANTPRLQSYGLKAVDKKVRGIF